MCRDGKTVVAIIDSSSPVFVDGNEYAKLCCTSTYELLVGVRKCAHRGILYAACHHSLSRQKVDSIKEAFY